MSDALETWSPPAHDATPRTTSSSLGFALAPGFFLERSATVASVPGGVDSCGGAPRAEPAAAFGPVAWAVVKKAFVAALVVLVVVTGLPLLMPGMGGAHCTECGPASAASTMCMAVVAAAALLASVLARRRARLDAPPRRGRVAAPPLERPPQLLVFG
ncbi:MAG: hypothetical protein ACLGI2_07950 [Acidimicrobiia bacterium]